MDIYALRTGEYRHLNELSFNTMPLYVEMIGIDLCGPYYIMYREHSPLSVLGYTLSGSGWIEQDGVEVRCETGQFFLLHSGGTHKYFPLGEWQFCWVNVRGDLWNTLLSRYGLSQTILYDIPSAGEKFLDCITSCVDAQMPAEEVQRKIQKELFGLLLCMYENRADHAPELARCIREELERCSLTHMTKEEICNRIGITVRHAQRVFQASYGMSLHDYICTRRVEHARSLLLNTAEPLRKIAEKVGFSDEKYFITFFKRHTGQTPADFRRWETERLREIKNESYWKK